MEDQTISAAAASDEFATLYVAIELSKKNWLVGIIITLWYNVPIELWWQDEMRLGQKNGIVRQWARKGTRPRQPKDQRYQNLYLFGAICPARGKLVALAMPLANTHAMQGHLKEISRQVASGAHGVHPCSTAPDGMSAANSGSPRTSR